MATYNVYITTEGDRWDLIAWRAFGDPHGYEPIIRANPAVGPVPVLPGGVRLLIPATETAAPVADALPPWKR